VAGTPEPSSFVQTVRGPVAAAELGRTLPHEHIVILQPEALQNYGRVWGASYWDEDAGVRDAIEKLSAVRNAGYRTLVDPTAPGLGRCIPRIQRINAEVDLNIVVATGVYAFLELPNFLHYRSPEAIAEFFVRELRDGIDDTGVRAAFIKCAVEEHGVVGDIPKVLDAVAIADSGAILGFDRFNIPHFNPDADRVRTLLALLEEGYGDRIHLSHDAACFMDFMVGDPNFADERPDYLHLSTQILPLLRDQGVTDVQIDELTIDNPRRFLEPSCRTSPGWASVSSRPTSSGASFPPGRSRRRSLRVSTRSTAPTATTAIRTRSTPGCAFTRRMRTRPQRARTSAWARAPSLGTGRHRR
jgi:phosphotriesterase-related protein